MLRCAKNRRRPVTHCPILTSGRRLEATQCRAEVLHDLSRENIRLRQVVQIGHGSVLKPKHVEAGLLPLKQLVPRVRAPSTVRGFFAPGLLPGAATLCVVARDEVLQMGVGQRFLLECVMHVGAVVVVPNLRRLRVGVGRTVVEEDDVRLNPLGVEDARRQPQDCVQVDGVKQFAPDRLASAALE